MTVTGECVWFTEESMKLLDLRLFTISCVCSLPQVKDLLRGKRSTVWTPSPIPACIYRSPRIQGLFISQMYESVQKKFIRYADIFASPLSPLHWSSLISFSNQWRESHTGDTDVCPEASADPRHADPLALSRPHAWPAQGTAAFPSTTLLQRPVVVLFLPSIHSSPPDSSLSLQSLAATGVAADLSPAVFHCSLRILHHTPLDSAAMLTFSAGLSLLTSL